MQDWIPEELATSDFGDERLDARYRLVLDGLSKKPSLSIPAALGGWSETCAAYRFFANDKVTPEEVLSPHRESTLKRMAGERTVLLVQDTTEIDLTRKEEEVSGAGPLNEETRSGFFSHVLFSFTPERVPLGVISNLTWARSLEKFQDTRKKSREVNDRKRRSTPIEGKESYRWLQGYREGCTVKSELPYTTVVVISDSEGDIYECLGERENCDKTEAADWIIRAHHNRRTISETGHSNWGSILEEVASARVLGEIDIEVSKNNPKRADAKKRKKRQRTGRTAQATVQATKVELQAPHRQDRELDNIIVNVIFVSEINPPKDETPIQWVLLTSLPTSNLKQAYQIIDYYACRWQIEIFFKTLKSGCRIQELQLEHAERYLPCLALYMIIAWRIMYVTMLGREYPDVPCDVIFEKAEWKSVYAVVNKKSPPKKPPLLEEMVRMIAGLGGYLGRKNDGPPGAKTIWIGMQQVPTLAQGWLAFGPESGVT